MRNLDPLTHHVVFGAVHWMRIVIHPTIHLIVLMSQKVPGYNLVFLFLDRGNQLVTKGEMTMLDFSALQRTTNNNNT